MTHTTNHFNNFRRIKVLITQISTRMLQPALLQCRKLPRTHNSGTTSYKHNSTNNKLVELTL